MEPPSLSANNRRLKHALTILVLFSGLAVLPVIFQSSSGETSSEPPMPPLWSILEDADQDGMTDVDELLWGMDPFNSEDGLSDLDGDEISLAWELAIGTNSSVADTDMDGWSDAEEYLLYGTDPLDFLSFPLGSAPEGGEGSATESAIPEAEAVLPTPPSLSNGDFSDVSITTWKSMENSTQYQGKGFVWNAGTVTSWTAYAGTTVEVWDAGGEKFVELDGSPENYGIKQEIAHAKAGGYILAWRQSGRNSTKAGDNPYSVRVYYLDGAIEKQIGQSEFTKLDKSQWINKAYAFQITPEQLAAAKGTPIYVAFIPTGSLNTYGTLIDKVSLITVEVAVDADRDGEITFDGKDKTTAEKPFRFWINNDDDSKEDEEEFGKDSQPDHVDARIPTQRDLEDFTRIQLMVGGLHEQLKSGEIQVTMKFKDGTVEGNPALSLWLHLDEDGDRDYLKDEQIAARHLAPRYPGRVTTSAGYTFMPSFWSGEGISNFSAITSEKPYRYLLFEGASKGKGKLILEFKKGDEVLGEACSCWVNLLDVRNMYQRAKITPDHPDDFTEPSDFVGKPFNSTITPPVPEIGWVWDPDDKDFIEDPEEKKEYLVFVHGWNMTYVDAQKYAESMFKRLWQTGYKGRYAFVRWPTYTGVTTYNASDYRAWLSGKGAAAFVNSLPSSYVRNITAHSMGNIVVSSALREGMQVENYALLNAAIPAMCYDGRELLYEFDRETPDGDADPVTKALGFKEKISQPNGARLINFYLEDDSALTGKYNVPIVGEIFGWEDNNENYKPESFNLGTTGYDYTPDRADGTKVYINFLAEFGRHLRLFQESAAYATASRTKAVGADGSTAGVINDKVDMDEKYGFGETHSAEWLWRIQKNDRFYHDLMEKLDLNPIP